ncbi:hypothetical protein BMG05_16585 [Mycobacterium malmoense]|nr:hypothetical protein BMG05_16585 [Mycobacterium malmoense]
MTPDDVEQYTTGRLAASDPETARLLTTALAAARAYCGWRVTPVAVETITVDGPGSRLLSLPTLQLVELQAVTENGVELDIDELHWSKAGLVRKKSGHRWSHRYDAITVTMNHGYDNAWGWQSAVLELIDRQAAAVGNVVGNSGPMVEKMVGHVTHRWALTISNPANQRLFSMLNHDLMDLYRLEQLP